MGASLPWPHPSPLPATAPCLPVTGVLSRLPWAWVAAFACMAAAHRDYASTRKGHSMFQHDEAYQDEIAVPDGSVATGMVCKKTTGHYAVRANDGKESICTISSMLRKRLIYPVADPTSFRRRVIDVRQIEQIDPVAIGDEVRFMDAGNGTGMIVEVLPRRSKLVRKAAGPRPLEQVIVANVDQVVVLVAATNPEPKWEVVDRFLAAAEWLGLPALICITKQDLVQPDRHAEEIRTYRAIGYPVLLTSVVTGAGISGIKEALAGRLSALVGPSGVGKTSLLNSVQPELGLRVGEVSRATNKGKHTTTHLELFMLDAGGCLVDTPGMREFGLWDVEGAELAMAFPELRPCVGRCQFGLDCSHTHEPGCAIKAAVAAGHVSERRYRSYLRMQPTGGVPSKRHR